MLGDPLVPLSTVDRIIAIGSDRMMNAVKEARRAVLAPYLKKDHVGIGSINSPMQCMMKEVCAQCLQKHVDPVTGLETGAVFSCFNQDQRLDEVDFQNLAARLRMNTVQEKLANLWLTSPLDPNISSLSLMPETALLSVIDTQLLTADVKDPEGDPIGRRVKRSSYADRSGDVIVVVKPYCLLNSRLTGTFHGSPHPYDTHVPLLVYGPGIPGGPRPEKVTPQAIAAIFAQSLGLPPPRAAEAPVPATLLDHRQ